MSQLEAVVVCPCCEREVPAGHPGRRGILINKKAALGARIAQWEWLVAHPSKATAARDADLPAMIERAKAKLAAVEEQLAMEPA